MKLNASIKFSIAGLGATLGTVGMALSVFQLAFLLPRYSFGIFYMILLVASGLFFIIAISKSKKIPLLTKIVLSTIIAGIVCYIMYISILFLGIIYFGI